MRRVIRQHPVLFAAFVLAAALTLFFATRMVVATIYWSDPAHRDQAIAGWMTPRYVSRSWRVPPEAILPALGAMDGPMPGRRLTIAELAALRGTTPEALAADIADAIARWRTQAR